LAPGDAIAVPFRSVGLVAAARSLVPRLRPPYGWDIRMFLGGRTLTGSEARVSEALTTCAYRSLDGVLRDLVDRAEERHAREWVDRDVARRIAVRRIGRAVGGAVGLLLGLSAFVCALPPVRDLVGRRLILSSVWLLLSAWPAAVGAGLVARLVVALPVSRRVHAKVSLTGNAGSDLVRLQTLDALGDARALAERWERAGAALPLAALSMVTPLTLHFLVWFLGVGPVRMSSHAAEFGEWISLSAMIVGHAHLALALCSVGWACSLCKRATSELDAGLCGSAFKALGITVGVACVPGLVLLAIPPLLVAITGAVFVPAMYTNTVSRLSRERLALAEPPRDH
jgi:hypothetical protein